MRGHQVPHQQAVTQPPLAPGLHVGRGQGDQQLPGGHQVPHQQALLQPLAVLHQNVTQPTLPLAYDHTKILPQAALAPDLHEVDAYCDQQQPVGHEVPHQPALQPALAPGMSKGHAQSDQHFLLDGCVQEDSQLGGVHDPSIQNLPYPAPTPFSPFPSIIPYILQLFFGFWAFEHLIYNKLSKVNCCLMLYLMVLARKNDKGHSESHLVPIFRRMIGSDGTTVN